MIVGNDYIDQQMCWLLHDLDLVSLLFIAVTNLYFLSKFLIFKLLLYLYEPPLKLAHRLLNKAKINEEK